MRTQSEDTSPEMERVQIELIRKASIAKRFEIMQSWSQLLIEANKQRVIEALEELGVPYHIGGSVASSIYGILRATLDADLIADLHPQHVRPLVIRLQTDYYIDEDMIRDAIKRRSSFNLIHLETMLKVDVYIPKSRPFDQEELRRVQQEVLLEGTRPFNVASPEGTILNKLE